jgi:hypothetical protein
MTPMSAHKSRYIALLSTAAAFIGNLIGASKASQR